MLTFIHYLRRVRLALKLRQQPRADVTQHRSEILTLALSYHGGQHHTAAYDLKKAHAVLVHTERPRRLIPVLIDIEKLKVYDAERRAGPGHVERQLRRSTLDRCKSPGRALGALPVRRIPRADFGRQREEQRSRA